MYKGKFSPWVWTELLAFDREAADCGVAGYLDELGFIPEGMCLLVSSPDFILSHPGAVTGRTLPADICARGGQPGNERRKRQEWRDSDLKKLISGLTQAGVEVYCSCFTVFMENKFTKEWISAHEEVRLCWANIWRGAELNPLAQLKDGSLFEDYIIPKIVEVCRDYGFAGWHGPDGWGPWSSGNICELDFSDSMMGQFMEAVELDFPEFFSEKIPHIVTQKEVMAAIDAGKEKPTCGLPELQKRQAWIMENCFEEWTNFLVGRWCQFWGKVLTALHSNNFKGVINSAWTKGCFDALTEYGVDYRKMAALGLDGMVVETVALGMNSTRPQNTFYHNFYAAALGEIKAAVPELKLIALHGIKDVEEFWDNLRHATTGYEKEMYKLGNMFIYNEQGKLQRAADGFLCCLADGIEKSEWDYIRERWRVVFDNEPIQAGVITAVYSDRYMDNRSDYWQDGFTPALDQVANLMDKGLAVQSFVHSQNAHKVPGMLLVPAAHLWEKEELDNLIANHRYPVVLCGRAAALKDIPGWKLTDNSIMLVIAAGSVEALETVGSITATQTAPDHKFCYFSEKRYRKEVADEFWTKGAEAVIELTKSQFPRIKESNMPVNILCKTLSDNTVEIGLENMAVWGRPRTTVSVPYNFEVEKIVSTFPSRVMSASDSEFTIPVPPRGVTALRIRKKPEIKE